MTVNGTAVAYSLTLDGFLSHCQRRADARHVADCGRCVRQLTLSGGTLSAQSISSNNTGFLSGYGTVGGAVSGDV